jgi:hypothetical protein
VGGGLLLLLFAAACGGRASVDRLDVLLAVQSDGSLEVQENWAVRFTPPESTQFRRQLPATHHDGLSGVRAYLDGRLLQPESGPQHADVRLGRSPRVDWTIAPIAEGVRQFQVRYRAAATLAISGGRARLDWPILASRHGWRIQTAQVVVTAPPGVVRVEPPGMAEAGWAVTERPDGFQAVRQDIGPSEPASAIMELGRDGLSAVEPAWQFAAERAAEFQLAFAAAGAFIGVVGLCVLVMVRVLLPAGRTGAESGASAPFDARPEALDLEVRRRLRSGRAGWLPRPGLFKYLVEVGLADRGRVAAANGLRVSGGVLVLLGLVLVVVVDSTLWTYGPWAHSVPVSVIGVGLLFIVAAARLNILTPSGSSVRAQLAAGTQ